MTCLRRERGGPRIETRHEPGDLFARLGGGDAAEGVRRATLWERTLVTGLLMMRSMSVGRVFVWMNPGTIVVHPHPDGCHLAGQALSCRCGERILAAAAAKAPHSGIRRH